MMDHTQWLLGKLAEEAAEVAQRAMKAQQFGIEEVQLNQPFNNLERLADEMYDLIVTWVELVDNADYSVSVLPSVEKKQHRLNKMTEFYKLSQRLGMVQQVP